MMTKQEVAELFRVLTAVRKLDDWLNDQEADSFRYLKQSKDPAVINHHQGRVSLIDDIREGIAAAVRGK